MNFVLKAIEKKPDPDVVKYLETVLENARAGDITGVLILEQLPAGGGLRHSCAGIEDRFSMVGYLMYAVYKLQSE